MNEHGFSPDMEIAGETEREINPLSFSEALDKLSEEMSKNTVDPEELRDIEHSFEKNWVGYSAEAKDTINSADEINANIAKFTELGKQVESVIDNSPDSPYSVELHRIMALLNGPRMELEQELRRREFAESKKPEETPTDEEAA